MTDIFSFTALLCFVVGVSNVEGTLNGEECFMGMKSGLIPDSAISASSYLPGHEPFKARLENGSYWTVNITVEWTNRWSYPWLEIYLGSVKNISGIIMPPFNETGVLRYYVFRRTQPGQIWTSAQPITDGTSNNAQVFRTDHQHEGRSYNRFAKVYSCLYVRIFILTPWYQKKSNYSLSVELVDGECFDMNPPWGPLYTVRPGERDYCNATQNIGSYTFPSTQPKSVSYSKEYCEGNDEIPSASISCNGHGIYDLGTLVNATCQSIENITNGDFTNTSLHSLQMATTKESDLTPQEVSDVTKFLAGVSNLDTEFSEVQVQEVAEISTNLIEYYEEQPEDDSYAEEKQELVKSISQISRKLDLPHANGSTFTASSKYVNIEVLDSSYPYFSYTFESTFINKKDDYDNTIVPMNITIPAEAFMRAKLQLSSSAVRVVSVGYKSSNFFPSEKKTNSVISSSLGNTTDSVEGISLRDEPVTFTHHKLDKPGKKMINDFKIEVTKIRCVYWDFVIGDWSERGCSLRNTTPVTCQCNHLTNFAILVSRTEIPNDFALTIVTYVGCGLSIICLLVTLIMICLTEKLRNKYQMKILGNICFCLAVAFTIFIFGVDALELHVGCSIVAAFMHFFFLAAWFWTSVYSYIIYRDIIQVIASYGRGYKVRYAAVAAYGLPFLTVALNASLTLGVIDNDIEKESSYRARNFCWLHSYSLYFGFLLVVGILLIFNIAVFCIVVPRVTCRKRKIQSSMDDSGIGKSVVTVVALVTTMGLSWIFGYLMLVSDNDVYLHVMSWLFTVVNAFQGVFIFYFTAIRSGELLRLCMHSRSSLYTVTTNSSRASFPTPESTGNYTT